MLKQGIDRNQLQMFSLEVLVNQFTLLKTKEKVTGEMATIFTMYNLRRAISILGANELIKRLKDVSHFVNTLLQAILKPSQPSFSIPCKNIVLFFSTIKFLKLQLYNLQ